MNVTDRSGQTPFAVALRTRDHEAAGAILAREPGAAEQVIEKCLNMVFESFLKIIGKNYSNHLINVFQSLRQAKIYKIVAYRANS